MDNGQPIEFWSAHRMDCDDERYWVTDLLDTHQHAYVVEVRSGEAIIVAGHSQIRSDVRAARIRLVTKRAYRSATRRAEFPCYGTPDEKRNGDDHAEETG